MFKFLQNVSEFVFESVFPLCDGEAVKSAECVFLEMCVICFQFGVGVSQRDEFVMEFVALLSEFFDSAPFAL
jgi:hypothetical protein